MPLRPPPGLLGTPLGLEGFGSVVWEKYSISSLALPLDGQPASQPEYIRLSDR